MVMANSMGEMGSPCRSPQAWSIGGPGMPLIITRVDAEERKMETEPHQCQPNPRYRKVSRRKGHKTELCPA